MSIDPSSHFQVTSPHERALVRVLMMAQHRQLSPAVMIDRLAQEFSRGPGQALRHLARLLSDGTPLINALEQSPRALHPSAVMALRLAIETGTFPERLESLIAGDPTPHRMRKTHWGKQASQFLIVIVELMWTWLILTFLMVFVVPTFQKMFQEFGVPLPGPMKLLIALTQYFAGIWALLLFFLLVCGMIALIRAWWLVGWHGRWSHPRADILALLALVVQARRPLAAGIDTLSRVHPIGRFRRQLKRVAGAIEGGESPWRALAENRLLTDREFRALQIADDPLAQGWLLRRASRLRSSSSDSRVHWVLSGISLFAFLLLAGTVMLAAVSMFMSVYGLVDGLSFMGNVR